MNKRKVSIILSIVCLLLTYGIFVQFKTIKNTNSILTQTDTENDLRDEVLKWKEKYDNIYKILQESEIELVRQRENSTTKSTADAQKESDIKLANTMLGLTEAKGKGITVTLNDNHSVTTETIGALDDIRLYLVHDSDIKNLIYELINAGAEAISINDQRIVFNTTITCDGNVVRINGEKVGAPYIINAIGHPETLDGAITRPGGLIELFNSTGLITDVKQNKNITIPKYNGIINFKYAQTVK